MDIIPVLDIVLEEVGERPCGLDASDDLEEQWLPGASDADNIESPF